MWATAGDVWKIEAERLLQSEHWLRKQNEELLRQLREAWDRNEELADKLYNALTPKEQKPNPGWQPTEADDMDPLIEDAINQRAMRGTQLYSELSSLAELRRRQRWPIEKIADEILRGADVDDDIAEDA